MKEVVKSFRAWHGKGEEFTMFHPVPGHPDVYLAEVIIDCCKILFYFNHTSLLLPKPLLKS
jgi:hypothetical protein